VVSVSRILRRKAPSRVTLFAVPKAFHGHIGVIQRNAIGSWLRLGPNCEVVLFGDEEGTGEAARELGVRHVPTVVRNEFGTPLLSSVFDQVGALAQVGTLCYVNSDIVLLDDFVPALRRVQARRSRYLMIGQCWDSTLDWTVDFDDGRWRDRLRELVATTERLRGRWGIDYFAFPSGLYGEVPPFAIGRGWFDNWLVWRARELGAAVVDATAAVAAIHQRHDYAHVPGGQDRSREAGVPLFEASRIEAELQRVLRSPEATENLRLAGGPEHVGSTRDAAYVLTPRRFRRRSGPLTFDYHWERWLRPVVWGVYAITRPIRHRLGIRAGMFGVLRSRLR
jgi:hypothetical protein